MFEVPRQIQSAAAGSANVAVDFPADTGIDVRRIPAVLWRGKATILWTTAASLLIAVMFVLIVPHRYTAMTQILIDPTDLHAVGNELTPTNLANDATVLQVESQVRVLTSDSVLRRVVKAEALDKDPEFAGQAGGEGTDSVAAALNALKRSIQVKRAERTYVVDVSVTTREPAKSAHIANAIAEAYLQEQTDVRSDAVRQISQSLSSRLTELKERVRAAEDRVEAFKQRNNILGASGQLVNEQQLTEMNNQLSAARARTASAKARLDQVQQVQLTKNEFGAFPEAVQSQTITALRSQYAEVMRREAEQMTSLGARHPAVIEIQAEAERLRRMVDDEVHRIAISARTEYESARANEETIAANLDKLKNNAMTTNEAMVTLRELERDVQANRAVYEAFLVRARETGAQERLDTKNIRVISQADIPLRRSFPPSNLLVAVGAILFGMAAGGGIVFARETYGSAGDFGRDLRRDSGRDFVRDSEFPRTGGTGVRGRLTNAVRDFLPAGRPSSIPVLAVLPSTDVSFGLSAAENPRSRLSMELYNSPSGGAGQSQQAGEFERSCRLTQLGPKYIDMAFRLAHRVDPSAELVLNEYDIECVGEGFAARREALLTLIRDLLARGVPLHGIGLQGHIRGQYEIDEDAVSRFVSEIRSLGLSVHVTELDVIDKDLPGSITVRDVIVAARAHDFLDAIFAVARPSVIATWGITDRYTWVPTWFKRTDGLINRPLPLDEFYRPKPLWSVIDYFCQKAV